MLMNNGPQHTTKRVKDNIVATQEMRKQTSVTSLVSKRVIAKQKEEQTTQSIIAEEEQESLLSSAFALAEDEDSTHILFGGHNSMQVPVAAKAPPTLQRTASTSAPRQHMFKFVQ